MNNEPTKKPVPSKTDDELKQLARDMVAGNIFVSSMIPDDQYDHMLGSVFMPIDLGALEHVDKSTIGQMYEYFNKAGPRSINGLPVFFSVQLINKEDLVRLREMCQAIQDATTAALDGVAHE